MTSGGKLLTFAALLLVAFGAALFAGHRIDWTPGTEESSAHGGDGHGAMAMADGGHAGGGHAGMSPGAEVRGLAVSEGGLSLVLDQTRLPLGARAAVRFRVLGADGRPVTKFDLEQTKRMHFIVIRRDLTGFQHLHPTMATDGTWSVGLRLPQAGSYRVFADFAIDGEKRTLGADVAVSGVMRARALPNPVPTVAVRGYRVSLASGTLRAGRESLLRFVVTRNGHAVLPDPYLGARGHLVALREGDLGYLHVHPDADNLRFATTFPTAGRYRLFLQFKAKGRLQVAPFTREATR
jgi:hypothetical protein